MPTIQHMLPMPPTLVRHPHKYVTQSPTLAQIARHFSNSTQPALDNSGNIDDFINDGCKQVTIAQKMLKK